VAGRRSARAPARKPSAGEDTARLETFSDGVFAIAITLLILEIRLPEGHGPLTDRIFGLWPSYAAYVLSFVTIGIMWANHHGIFRLIDRTTHGLVVSNLLLLLLIAFIPFPTSVLGEHLEVIDKDSRVAAVFYNGSFLVTAAFYNLLWQVAARGHRLIAKGAEDAADEVTRRFRPGVPMYLVATIVSFFSAQTGIALNAAIALFYLVPRREAL
jgi:uncharacterized membrane protein